MVLILLPDKSYQLSALDRRVAQVFVDFFIRVEFVKTHFISRKDFSQN